MIQYWGKGGGGKSHFFLLILYNFKNIGGGGGTWPSRSPLLRGPCQRLTFAVIQLVLNLHVFYDLFDFALSRS